MYELELVTYSTNYCGDSCHKDGQEQTTQFVGNCPPSCSSVSSTDDSCFDLDETWETLEPKDLQDWNLSLYLEEVRRMNPNLKGNGSSSTFYIDLHDGGMSEKSDGCEDLEPDLLPGEHCIARAHRVISYSTVQGLTSGVSGSLFVTTLKLSLKLHLDSEQTSRENLILGEWDVPLTSIYALYEISGETGDKKKRLPLGSTVNTKIDAVFIVCKNFRFLQFNFKFAKIDQGRSVVNALLHHVRPKKSNLLFAFEQKNSKKYQLLTESEMSSSNWSTIMDKSGCKDVRITRVNERWQVCTNLPQQFVVPNHINDDQVSRIAGIFPGSRPPVWVWGVPDNGAMYIQPQLNVQSSLQVDQLRKTYYGLHEGKKIREVELSRLLPNQTLLEEAYPTMLDMHCVDNERDADKSDYLSKMEALGWLTYIGAALRTATDVCEIMGRGETAVLIDSDGRGPSILVASLVQLLLEPDFRSRTGFQLLIQNNWVSLGYPFSAHNQICSGSSSNSVTPLFLIFLDCVHQLITQFPSLFEFRSVYLIDLIDTSLLPIFDTFIFDCEHDRQLAHRNPETPLNPFPAWHWEVQFSSSHINSWTNPLYKIPRRPVRMTSTDPSTYSQIMTRNIVPSVPENKPYLPVDYHISGLSIWTELFHRSVPFFQIPNNPASILINSQRKARDLVEQAEPSTVKDIQIKGVPAKQITGVEVRRANVTVSKPH